MRPSRLAPPEVWALLSLNLRRRPEQYPARVFGVKSLSLLWGFSCYVRQGRLCVCKPNSRGVAPPAPVDLDLASPGCPRPVAFDEDVNEAPESVPDLSVTAPPSAQEVSAPAPALPPEQELLWQQLFSSPQSAFTASAASGTIRTYEYTLRAIVPQSR